jgi:biotin transport system substrate-specific component
MEATRKITLSLNIPTVFIRVFGIIFFAGLTALGAQIQIPVEPVPFTFQTIVVLIAGAFLGKFDGALSQVLYVASGAVGLPVFAGGTFGIAKLFGPTGGYLIGFVVSAFFIGWLIEYSKKFWWVVFSMFLGSIIILLLGTIQLNFVLFNDWTKSFKAGFLIFSWWDILKIFVAASTYDLLKGRVNNGNKQNTTK